MEERHTHKDHEREIRLADWKHFSFTICIMNFKLLIPACVFLSASLSFYFFFFLFLSLSPITGCSPLIADLQSERMELWCFYQQTSEWTNFQLSLWSHVSCLPPLPPDPILCQPFLLSHIIPPCHSDSFLLFRKWLKSLLEYVMFLYRLRWRFHHSCETFSCENSRVPLIISVDCPVLVSVFECLMRFGLLEDVRVESSGSRSSCCCCSTAWSCLPDH